MFKRGIVSNGENWDCLATFRVQAEVTFDAANLGIEIRRRLKLDFPIHFKGISVEHTANDSRSYLTVTYPVQMICGKKLTEEVLLDALREIETETLAAIRQHSLLELVAV